LFVKQIPNIFTLLNLVLGCMAIVFTLQNGIIMVADETAISGYRLDIQAEQVYLASVCIGLAAVVDFFDGFLARLLGATGEMGKQLDSLADVVSFGVAPALFVYQLLRLALAKEAGGLSAGIGWLLPAFLLPAAAAWRLARFNIDTTTPAHYFRGTPVPSVGLALAGLPLIWWQATQQWEVELLTNKWFLYAIVACCSLLMVSNLPILSNKPKGRGAAKWAPYLLVALTGGGAALFLGWWAVPVTFAAFVLFSVVFKKQIV
jgi:CDP-diacylglycerol--serine O-phosphatidyltransferase